MKILQINRYHHRTGGSDTVYFNTAKLLESKGHQVSFFAMDYPENAPSDQSKFFTKVFDFNTLRIKDKIKNFSNFFYNTDAAKCLDELITEVKPDLAHLHLFYGSLTSSILVTLKKRRIPVVITAHDYRLICPVYVLLDGKNQICERCKGHNFFHCATNKCAKNSYLVSVLFSLEAYYRNMLYSPKSYINKIIFVSQFTMKMHLKHRPELKDMAVQLHNFIPTVEHSIHIRKKGQYFLYIGRLSFEKGLFTLINAFNLRPQHKLIIAGAGPLLDRILKYKNKNVEYYGFAKGVELESLIGNCSFVIVPSEWYETLGMSAAEALSLGKPVIAANIGGLPEVVEHRQNGFLFEPFSLEDLLEKIDTAAATSDEEYNRLSVNAIKVEENKFNQEKHYEELMKIYRAAINDSNF